MTDFNKPNGWQIHVSFPHPNTTTVRVLNPAGNPIALAGPGNYDLAGLTGVKGG